MSTWITTPTHLRYSLLWRASAPAKGLSDQINTNQKTKTQNPTTGYECLVRLENCDSNEWAANAKKRKISEEAYMQTKKHGWGSLQSERPFSVEDKNQNKTSRRQREIAVFWKKKKILQDKSEQLKTTTIKQANKNGPVGTGINAQDESHELRNKGEISWWPRCTILANSLGK